MPKMAEDMRSSNQMSGSSITRISTLDMKGKGPMQDASVPSTSRKTQPSYPSHMSQMSRTLNPRPPRIPHGKPGRTKVRGPSNLGQASRASSAKELEATPRQWEMDFRRSMTAWYHALPRRERDPAMTRGIRQSQLSKQLEDVDKSTRARDAIKAYSDSRPTDLSPLKPIINFLLKPGGSTESKLDAIELLSLLVSPTELSMRETPYILNVAIEMADKCLQFQNIFFRVANLYKDDQQVSQHASLAYTILSKTLNSFWKYNYHDLVKVSDPETLRSSASQADLLRFKSMDIKSNRARHILRWMKSDELQIQYPSLDFHSIMKEIESGLRLRMNPAVLSTDLRSLEPLIEILTKQKGDLNSRKEIARLISYLVEDTMELTSSIKNPEQVRKLQERLQNFQTLLEPFSLIQGSYLQEYPEIASRTNDRLQKIIGSDWATKSQTSRSFR